MKVLGLLAVVLILVSSAAMAETVSFDIYADWNFISLPQVPFNSSPTQNDGTYPGVFGTRTIAFGQINRWSSIDDGIVDFDPEDPAIFGGMLLGEGYWFFSGADGVIEYEALAAGVPSAGVPTDMWISLPGKDSDWDGTVDAGGWHTIGTPFAEPVNWTNLRFTDGKDIKTWPQANLAGWVSNEMAYYVGGVDAGYGSVRFDGEGTDEFLQPNYGYGLLTNQPNLAMIVLAP